MDYSFSSRVTIGPDVLFRPVGDETVLLQLNNETYFGLDMVGTRMWDVLTAAPCIQDAYDLLLDEYAVEAAELRSDLNKFLNELIVHRLIRVEIEHDEIAATAARG